MMKFGNCPEKYLDGRFWQEMQYFGADYTQGAQKLGFKDPQNFDQFINFRDQKMPDGQKDIGRRQHNRNDSFIGILNTADPSFNHMLMHMSPEGQKKFAQEVWLPALKEQEQLLNMKFECRSGAQGKDRVAGEMIGLHGMHGYSREGEFRFHSHDIYSRFGVAEDGRILSGDFNRILKHNFNTEKLMFQLKIGTLAEEKMGWRVNFDDKTQVAYVEGMPRTHDNKSRKEAAKEYLKDRGIDETPVAMAYAMQNTRPPKEPFDAKKLEQKTTQKQETVQKMPQNGICGKLYSSLIAQPLEVYKEAWKASHKNGQTITVSDVEKFLKDASKTPRAECHKAAVAAVKKTQCKSFDHALSVAEKGFKDARKPKVQLEKGTTIEVAENVKVTKEQQMKLEAIAKKHKCTLEIQEDQKQKQEQGRKL